jgi:hypothetical protein
VQSLFDYHEPDRDHRAVPRGQPQRRQPAARRASGLSRASEPTRPASHWRSHGGGDPPSRGGRRARSDAAYAIPFNDGDRHRARMSAAYIFRSVGYRIDSRDNLSYCLILFGLAVREFVTLMPRFYFHQSLNGQSLEDPHGLVFADQTEAREHAVHLIPAVLKKTARATANTFFATEII